MMHGREKSDSVVVAVKSPNKTGEPERRRWSEGRGPRRTRASNARAGHRAGKACHRPGARTDGRKVLPSLSEVGAGCGKAARPVLGGGTRVTRFPTAIASRPLRRIPAIVSFLNA